MSFFVNVPSGNIVTSSLKEILHIRLHFLSTFNDTLIAKYDDTFTNYSNLECLIPNSPQNIISHHILRLMCSLKSNYWNHFISIELKWFKYCLNQMNTEEFWIFWKKLLRNYTSLDQHPLFKTFRNTFIHIIQTIDHRFKKYLKFGRKLEDKIENRIAFRLPFMLSLKLLAKRKILVVGGQAHIPYKYIKTVLAELFVHLLNQSQPTYAILATFLIKHDKRLQDIYNFFRKIIDQELHFTIPHARTYNDKTGVLKAEDLDCLVQNNNFPPCMEYLHLKLRFIHRLDHHSRIRYTLFLKNIGLPHQEAHKFWKDEYSKTKKCAIHGCSCTHLWGPPCLTHTRYGAYQSDEGRRYTYNLRHLYGLEGSRKNYSCHSCTRIQSKLIKDNESTGCPFKHFDDRNLLKFLGSRLQLTQQSGLAENKDLNNTSLNKSDLIINEATMNPVIQQIMEYRREHKYAISCSLYADARQKKFLSDPNIENDVKNSTTLMCQSPNNLSVNFIKSPIDYFYQCIYEKSV